METPRPVCPGASPAPRRAALACLLALLLCAACRGSDPPAPIAYGAQKCDHCGSVIAERRFAAEYRDGNGTLRAFDEPSCLFAALAGRSDVRAVFFQDYAADGWIAAADLYLVSAPGIATPHRHGWVALGSFSAAQDLVTKTGGGDVLRFDEAREKLR